MSQTVRTAVAARDAAVDAIVRRCDGGTITIYTGPQPATPEAPPLGAELAIGRFGTPAFGRPENGVAVALTIEDEPAIARDGRASWFRVADGNGAAIWDGSCGTVGDGTADLLFDVLDLIAGARLTFPSLSYSLPMASAT